MLGYVRLYSCGRYTISLSIMQFHWILSKPIIKWNLESANFKRTVGMRELNMQRKVWMRHIYMKKSISCCRNQSILWWHCIIEFIWCIYWDFDYILVSYIFFIHVRRTRWYTSNMLIYVTIFISMFNVLHYIKLLVNTESVFKASTHIYSQSMVYSANIKSLTFHIQMW